MSKVNECALSVFEAFKERGVTKADVSDQLAELDKLAKEASAGNPARYADELMRIIESPEFSGSRPDIAKIRRINNIIKKREMQGQFERIFPKRTSKEFGHFLNNYLSAAVEGRATGVLTGITNYLLNNHVTTSGGNRISLFNWLKANANDRDAHIAFSQEMEAISAGKQTGNQGEKAQAARMIAQHIMDRRARMREGMLRNGVDIRLRNDYQGSQSLSQHRVAALTADEFIDKMMGRIDWAETMGYTNVAESQKRLFLRKMHDRIVNGEGSVYGRGMFLSTDEADLTPSDITRAHEQSRDIKYLDHESYVDAMTEFGAGGNVFENALQDMVKMARQSALVERAGADVAQNYRALRKDMGFTKQDTLFSHDAIMKNITGEADMIGSTKHAYQAAKILGGTRNVITSGLMGEIFMASVPDATVARATIQRATGQHASMIKTLMNTFTRIEDDEGRRIFANMINVHTNMLIDAQGGGMSRFGDVMPGGVTSWMARKVYWWGGMNWQEAGQKEGVIAAISNYFYNSRNKSFAEVQASASFDSRMDQFGITERHWDFYRKLDAVKDRAGNFYMTTDALKEVDGSVIARDYLGKPNASSRAIDAARDEMVTAFEAYFTRQANTGVLTPTARDRSIQNFGYKRGTAPGEAFRTTLHLTSYPLMVATRVLSPMIQQQEFGMLALYIAQATALGYVSMISRDAMRGRYRDYLSDDPKMQAAMFFEAVQRGGAGAIFYDLFYQWAQFGQDPTGRFGGLSMNAASDAFNIMERAGKTALALATDEGTDEAMERLKRDTVRTVRNYMPFSTLPGIRFAIDALLYYPVLDQVSPESTYRIEQNWEERTGGGYMFPVSR